MSAGSSGERTSDGQGGSGPGIENVTCVIVSYRPDVVRLAHLCANVLMDGARVIVVDNTEAPGLISDQLPVGCELIALGSNSGIAHAQNVGVAHALAAGATVIVFFDQDSKIGPGFLRALVAPLKPGTPEITSPLYVDDDSGVALPSLRLGRFGLPITVHGADATKPYPVDIVISSGTAATSEVFGIAGVFDEALFIDGVDSEWCLRCRGKQIPIYVVPSAVMRHRVGSRSIRIGRFTVLQHSPARCYYQIRNCFHLMRRKHVPFAFALRHMLSVMCSRLILLVFVSDRLVYLKACFAGLRDGMKGVAGARPN
jgi:rhamnosyltransferase